MRDPGLVFEPTGQLILATGRWTMIIRVQHYEIQKQKGEIQTLLQNVTEVLTDSAKLAGSLEGMQREEERGIEEGELRRMKTFYKTAEQSWAQEKTWMTRELATADKKIERVLREKNKGRKGRSLVPFIGDGLRYLFGTATEKETAKLHKAVRGVQAKAGRLQHVQELQATLIGRLVKEERHGRRQLHALVNETNEIVNLVEKARDHSHAVHRRLQQEVGVTRALGVAARTAGAAVLIFGREVATLVLAMTKAREEKLAPEIITPRAFVRALKQVQAQLPWGWTVAVPDAVWARRGYDGLAISTVPLDGGYEVHIQIPLRQTEGSLFDLYRITALPAWLSNRTVGVMTDMDVDWFAITPDQRLHLELKHVDLEQCQRVVKWTVCEDLPLALREDRRGCLYQSFRRNGEAIGRVCKRRVVPLRRGLRRVSRRHWAYAFPEKEIFTLQCGERVTEGAFYLHGTGVFEVPPGCSAVGDRFVIPARLDGGQTRVDGPKFEDLAVFNTTSTLQAVLREIEVEGGEEASAQNIHLVKVADDVEDDKIVNATLDEVKRTLMRSRQVQADDGEYEGWTTTVRQHGPLTLSTVCLVGVAILAVRACIRRRRRASGGAHTVGLPLPEGLTAINTRLDSMVDVVIRVTKLEERVDGNTKDVERLKKFM